MKQLWIIILIGIIFGMIACSESSNEPDVTYTVTFDADGGTPVPQAQIVQAGEKVAAPANPAKQGYVFLFWHLSGANTAYNFQTPVNSDIALQAKWENEATAEYWQVAWELNGGVWSAEDNHATKVIKGGTLAEPAAPTKSSLIFDGWYKESELTNKINFPYNVSAVTANFTLYAKWGTGGQTGEVSLNKTSLTLHTTDRERLTVSPTSGNTPAVTWSTSNKEIAMVDDKGIVKATGAGNAIVTATISGKSITCSVVVNPVVLAVGELGHDFGDNEIQLWKNGKRWVLNDNLGASIRSMFIYEGDVYLAGSSHDYSYNAVDDRAIVFKLKSPIPGEQPDANDEEQYIMETTGKYSRGHGLFVSNGDVYVCGEDRILQSGHTNRYYYRPTLWKNGKLQHLASNTSGERYTANAVFVSGNDVYVAGQSNYNAAIWKNGIIQELPCEGAEQISFYAKSEATSIFVSGSDVYAVGSGRFRSTSSSKIPDTKPVLWKNGTDNILQHNYGSLLSVLVYGNDVYALGYEGMWKNGVLTILDSGTFWSSISIYGNDLYTAGYDKISFNRLWKNGIPVELEGDIIGEVYSVIVK